MVETYKYKSKLATAISFIAAFIIYVGKDEIAKILPAEYAFLAGIIVLIAGYIVTQGTENTRVDVAQQMIKEKYTTDIEPDSETISGDNDAI